MNKYLLFILDTLCIVVGFMIAHHAFLFLKRNRLEELLGRFGAIPAIIINVAIILVISFGIFLIRLFAHNG